MGSFNPINFIVNTVNVLALNQVQAEGHAQTGTPQQNAVNQNGVLQAGTPLPQGQTSSFSPINYSSGNVVYQGEAKGLAADKQVMISTVEVEQQANYVKDLLGLPRDLETLIKQIQGNDPNALMLKNLNKLLSNGKINLTALTSILTENSNSARQKLMMTIMTVSKMGANNVNQLKELMGLLSTSNSPQTSAQTVKNLLMLYLPWLPLSIRNDMNLDFNIDIFDKIQGPDPDSENAGETIKIMIQTANYGNIMAELELAMNNEVDVYITAPENFPEKEVMEKFKNENKENSIRTNVTIEKSKDIDLMEKTRNIKITSSDYVSPKLVLAAHSLIKIIIDVDSSNFIINEENEG